MKTSFVNVSDNSKYVTLTLQLWLSSYSQLSIVCQPKPEIDILSSKRLIPPVSWWHFIKSSLRHQWKTNFIIY